MPKTAFRHELHRPSVELRHVIVVWIFQQCVQTLFWKMSYPKVLNQAWIGHVIRHKGDVLNFPVVQNSRVLVSMERENRFRHVLNQNRMARDRDTTRRCAANEAGE